MAAQFAPNTINRRLAALRAIVRFARVVGVLRWDLSVQAVRTVSPSSTRSVAR